jgi:hypothetical protein
MSKVRHHLLQLHLTLRLMLPMLPWLRQPPLLLPLKVLPISTETFIPLTTLI